MCLFGVALGCSGQPPSLNDAGGNTGGAGSVGGGSSCELGSYAFPGGPSYTTQSGQNTLSRITTWEPGVPGGVPNLTTICKTLSPTGKADDGPINQAIGSCPANQVVQLNPGTYNITNAIMLSKDNVVLRGSGGPGADASVQTRLMADPSLYGPVVNIGPDLFPHNSDTSVNCSADAMQGDTSVTVSSASGFHEGDLVLIDITVDAADDTGTGFSTHRQGAPVWSIRTRNTTQAILPRVTRRAAGSIA